MTRLLNMFLLVTPPRCPLPLAIFALLLGCVHFPAASQLHADDFFQQQVLPILESHCFQCHSHDHGTMEGNLALDWRSGWEVGGDRGPAVIPGDVEQSLLLQAVRHSDPDLQMPPEKMDEAQIAILERWVREGAADPRVARPEAAAEDPTEWWSLKPLERREPPGPEPPDHTSATAAAGSAVIDAWIDQQLRKQQLSPQPLADRRTLIRRLWLDLLGLHPSWEEVEAFQRDAAPDAWERLVEKCLASPQYGERWARHWLDTVHFADSHGFEHDVFRPHAWPYRDYVIDAFNRDLPWSDFVKAQLAADYFFPDDTDSRAALGFLGAGPYDQSAAATAPLSFEYLDRDDLVTQVCGSLLSTTANCARCHSHKFDPISQEDYFALQAVFAGVLKGDIRYDTDAQVAAQRRFWQQLHDAATKKDAQVLLSATATEEFQKWWEQEPSFWTPLSVETFHSTGGAALQRLADHSILSTGPPPERDTVVVSASANLGSITAFRLDLLTDPSLPMNGPGRAANGNLHLNEIQFHYFAAGADTPQKLHVAAATADFDQTGWTIQQAIDGNPQTAWGIHPFVGQAHFATFQLKEPLALQAEGKLVVSLQQTHGGSHLIGRFLLSATDADPSTTAALSAEALAIAGQTPAERTPEQELKLRAEVLQWLAKFRLSNLPEQAKLYAVGSQVENERGTLQVPSPPTIHVLARGDLEKPRQAVAPGALSVLKHMPARFEAPARFESPADVDFPDDAEVHRRAALALWIVHPENGLTWRSIANRVWYHHFGRGLSDTPNDFGRMGQEPTHPELLDWLACEVRDHNGSLKHLHRLICNSQAYQRASTWRTDLQAQDPQNAWLARMSRRRLDAESFRDSVLVLSGRLDLTGGGPGIKYFAESPGPQVTPKLDYEDFDLEGPHAQRRSIYRVVWRGIPDPLFEALDFPDLGLLVDKRHQSASPLQALTLLNHRLVLHHAKIWADTLTPSMPDNVGRSVPVDPAPRAGTSAPSGPDPASLITTAILRAVRQCWLREATPEELQDLESLAAESGLPAVCRLLICSNEFLYIN